MASPREVMVQGKKLLEYDVACPKCGKLMALRPSKFGIFYGCQDYPRCVEGHGAHPSGAPMGTPATKEGKAARIQAHAAFDTLWNTGGMTRKAAYQWMQEVLGLTKEQAHIGHFDLAQCNKLIEVVKKHQNR